LTAETSSCAEPSAAEKYASVRPVAAIRALWWKSSFQTASSP
jgi:hypothetical protein